MSKHYSFNYCLRWCCFCTALLGTVHLAAAQDHLYADAKSAVRQNREEKRSLRDLLNEVQNHFNVSFVYESELLEGKEVAYAVKYGNNVESTLSEVLNQVGL